MRSNLKLLIIAAVLLVILAGTVVALTLTGDDGGKRRRPLPSQLPRCQGCFMKSPLRRWTISM